MINDQIIKLAENKPMIEVFNNKLFKGLYESFLKAVKEQVNKKQCGWCLRPVKISHLTTEEKAIFYSSSLYPKCEEEQDPKEKTIGLN